MLLGVRGDRYGQEGTLYRFNKHLNFIRMHLIWDQKALVCYKNPLYMGSTCTCLLQEATLYGVTKYLSVTRSHFIWGQ